jgi:hypothetical protein
MLMVQNMCIGNGSTRKAGRFTIVLLLLFLLATFATAFHHHEDGGDHHDCPICAAGLHYSPASVNSFSFAIHQTVSNYEIPKEPFLYDCIRVILLTSRAPPA